MSCNKLAPQGLQPVSELRPTPGKVASNSSVQYAPERRASAIGLQAILLGQIGSRSVLAENPQPESARGNTHP